jgi:ADP-ribosylglycohydrolase
MHPDELLPRFVGCLLGGAIGDALGAPVQFMSLDDMRLRFGAAGVTGYSEVYGRRGSITDDTQMSLFTAEGIIRAVAAKRSGVLDDPLGTIHRAYLRWLHSQAHSSAHPDFDDAIDGWLIRLPGLHSQRSPGRTCLSALMLPHAGTIEHPPNDAKGSEAVARIAPIGLWGEEPFGLGCRVCALTHGHATGYLAGGLFSTIIAYLVGGTPIDQAVRHSAAELRPRLSPQLRDALDRAITAADAGVTTAEVVESLGQGWIAEEAVSIAIYCAMVAMGYCLPSITAARRTAPDR